MPSVPSPAPGLSPKRGGGTFGPRGPAPPVTSSKASSRFADGWWSDNEPSQALLPRRDSDDEDEDLEAGLGEEEKGGALPQVQEPPVGQIPSMLDGGPASEARKDRDTIVYTFGAPRVGNNTFARLMNSRVPHMYRVVFDGDLVAGIPKFMFMFKHAGTEVVLDGSGNLIVDPSFVESKLRARTKRHIASHAMASYRGGLLRARVLEGLPLPPGYVPPA